MGAAVEAVDGAQALLVPRRRFEPVKTTADLLLIRSDRYRIDDTSSLQRVDPHPVPEVELGPEFRLGVGSGDASRALAGSRAAPGTMLVLDGANTGATARVQPAVRNPRTAVGVNAAGTTLYLCDIDGRQTAITLIPSD